MQLDEIRSHAERMAASKTPPIRRNGLRMLSLVAEVDRVSERLAWARARQADHDRHVEQGNDWARRLERLIDNSADIAQAQAGLLAMYIERGPAT